MSRALLVALLIVPECLLMTGAYRVMLRMKRPRLLTISSVIVIPLLNFMTASLPYSITLLSIKMILMVGFTFGILLYTSAERPGKVLVAGALQTCVMLVVELLVSFVWGILNLGTTFSTMFGDSMQLFIMLKSLSLICYGPLACALAYTWNRIMKGPGGHIPLAVAFFPISQMALILEVCATQVTLNSMSPAVYLTCAFNVLICVVVDILLIWEVRKLWQYFQLEQKQRQAEQQFFIQENYYSYLEEKLQVANKLRHDMDNQLQAAFALLEENETALVETQLEELRQDLSQTASRQFCNHPIVDAVLEDKAAGCTQLGITLETELTLSLQLEIEPAALCSVFSNLLDNAIHACRHCSPEARFICCTGLTQGEYLVVEVVNSKTNVAASSPLPTRKGQGLGLIILNDIATAHGGRFEHRDNEDTFAATIWLKLNQAVAS